MEPSDEYVRLHNEAKMAGALDHRFLPGELEDLAMTVRFQGRNPDGNSPEIEAMFHEAQSKADESATK